MASDVSRLKKFASASGDRQANYTGRPMDLGLAGKRAIVTGGTRGIGRRIVDLLVAKGCHVGFCARDQKQIDSAVAELAGRTSR